MDPLSNSTEYVTWFPARYVSTCTTNPYKPSRACLSRPGKQCQWIEWKAMRHNPTTHDSTRFSCLI